MRTIYWGIFTVELSGEDGPAIKPGRVGGSGHWPERVECLRNGAIERRSSPSVAIFGF
ncbi:hypothetical protein GYB59_19950 [bacterium]|nr:hypothetical protein [bacterium]